MSCVPDRGERAALRCFVECLGATLFGVALLGVAALPSLPAWRAVPSPWALVGAAAPVASVWTVHRLRRRHEAAALQVGARPPWRLGVAVLLLSLSVGGLAALAGGGLARGPNEAVAGDRVSVAVDAALLTAPDGSGARWHWAAGSRWPERLAGVPADFRPVPRHLGRYQLRLLLARAPWDPADHPLDPTLARWLVFGLGPLVAGVWLARRLR